MKKTSEQFRKKAESNSARYYVKYTVGDIECRNTLNTFELTCLVNGNSDISLGNTCAASVSFSIYKPEISLENKEITIYEGIDTGEKIEYVQLGIFKITKQESDGEYTKYEGVDRMAAEMDMGYFSTLEYPSTDRAVLEEICTMTGIQMDSVLTDIHPIKERPEGYTYREMIGYLAALQGKNAVMNAAGNLELKWYTQTDYRLDGSKYYQGGATFSTGNNFVLGLLTCNAGGSSEKNILTSGSGATGITFSNPFMTQAVLDEIYQKIGGFTYRPMEVRFVGDFRIEPGDIITVHKDGVDYIVPVMQITHQCDGGLITTVKSIGQSDTANSRNTSGPATQKLKRFETELALVSHALVNKLDAETASLTYASIEQMKAVNAAVDNLKANALTVQKADLKYAAIERLDAADVRITALETGSADVGVLRTQMAELNTLMFGAASGGSLTTAFSNSVAALIGEAQIRSAMIKDLAADKINAGKINTNLVEMGSESGNLMISDNTILIKDGNKTARVQLGKDAAGDYSLYVWDAGKNLMFDARGLTEDGIQRAIIRDDMVSDNANISAGKLDIKSLFTEINGSSETIKSSRIYVDADKQTLDVAFKTVKTATEEAGAAAGQAVAGVQSLTDTVKSQGTQLSAVQGQISSKVWQQDITTAVDSLQIGGRNILTGTGDFTEDCWVHPGADRMSDKYNNLSVLSAPVSDTSSSLDACLWRNLLIEPDTFYTLSFYAKAEIPGMQIVSHLYPLAVATGYNKQGNTTTSSDGNIKTTVTDKWERYWITWRTREDISEDKTVIPVRLMKSVNTACIGKKVYVCGVKLEKGSKATDWSPAPEDTDASITALEGAATTLANQYTSLNQTLNSLSATVNSNTTAISKKADGSTVTSLQNTLTSLQADLTGFKSTVSSTYTTKTEFTGLQIGGRNYALNTGKTETFTFTDKTNGPNVVALGHQVNIGKDWKIGDTISVSLDVDFYNVTMADNGYIQLIGGGDITGHASGWFIDYMFLSGAHNGYTNTVHVQYQFKITENHLKNNYWNTRFRCDYCSAGTMTMRHFKVEHGNRFTDWSPAPEDVDAQIATVDSKFGDYATTAALNSAIDQTASSITQSVSATYAAKSSLNAYATTQSVNASLALKIDRTDTGQIVSMINASADEISLKANRFSLDSTYSKINRDGSVEFTKGIIGGFTLTEKLSATAGNVYINPGMEEINKIKNYMLGFVSLTKDEQKLYDINGDGVIDLVDVVAIKRIMLGVKEYSSYKNAVPSTVHLQIDPTHPQELIKLWGTNPWGRKLEQRIGINGIDATAVRAETVNAQELNLNGIPVIESGTVSNGLYIKFANGIMLCAMSKEFINIGVHIEWGCLYETQRLSMGDFPANFSGIPYVTAKVTNRRGTGSAAGFVEGPYDYNERFAGEIHICRPTEGNFDYIVDVIAVGFWKA